MIKVNFNKYASYVADSLTQWDVNQVLRVEGLNLSVAPEVHFTNAILGKSLVRQAELDKGVVSVKIPNSLLQNDLDILAYVGLYEGSTFKVIETVRIPVIKKEKPEDYKIENDEEIYSFNELENKIVNAKDDMRKYADNKNATLSAQVANIIAHNNDTDGNTELIDIRTGADGKIYGSAGEATRKQIRDLTDRAIKLSVLNGIAYPANNGTIHFTITGNGSNAIIHVDFTGHIDYCYLNVKDFVFSRINVESLDGGLDIPVNSHLVIDVVDNVITVKNDSELRENSDRYIYLMLNHYGNVKGPWFIYYINEKLSNSINTLDLGLNTVENKISDYETVKDNIRGIEDKIGNVSVISEIIEGESGTGSVEVVDDKVSIGSQTWWFHKKADITPGETYIFTFTKNSNKNVVGYIKFADSNDTVISMYENGVDTTEIVSVSYKAPVGSSKVYIISCEKNTLKVEHIVKYNDLQTQIDEASTEIVELKKELPEYYTDEWLNNIYSKIREKSSFVHGVSFAFITDLHFPANALNSKKLLKKVLDNTSVPYIISGGDYPQAFGTREDLLDNIKTLHEYANYIGKDRFFSIRGNHDFSIKTSDTESTGYTAPYGHTYDAIARVSENWVKKMDPDHLCFYLENETQKTRIICLNSSDGQVSDTTTPWGVSYLVTKDQIEWLLNEAMNCSGYKFIFISHIPADPSITSYHNSQDGFHAIFKALKNKTTVTVDGITVDFTNSDNEAICHIVGHNHKDESHVDDNFLSISTSCDACYGDDGHGATRGTLTEQAFDVFCIDYDKGTIETVRVGRGSDRNWNY